MEPERVDSPGPPSINTEPVLRAAHTLARSGYYTEAEGLLSSFEPIDGALEAALLRAKMFAQQGNAEAARACWQLVLDQAPNCAEARAGIARLDSHGAGTRFSALLRVSLVLAALAALVLLIAAGLAVIGGNVGSAVAVKRTAELMSNAALAPVAELTREVNQSRAALHQIEIAQRDQRAALDEFRRVLAAYHDSIAKLNDGISALEASSASSIRENHAALSALQVQLAALTSDIEAAASRSAEIQSAAESRLGAIESSIKAARDAAARQGKDIREDQMSQFAALESAVTSLRRELDVNRAAIEQLAAAVHAVETATDAPRDEPAATPAPKGSLRKR